MKAQGFRCIYSPMVKAIWHGSRESDSMQEHTYLAQLREDYPEVFKNDPFYNPNLSLDSEWFLGYRDFPIEGIVSSQ
jgi:hypothetical protein